VGIVNTGIPELEKDSLDPAIATFSAWNAAFYTIPPGELPGVGIGPLFAFV
jgi:hypothetical protein